MLACCCPALHLWIADQIRNDATMCCIVFTLTPTLWIADQVRNDGPEEVGLACCLPCRPSGLRIKSAMTGRGGWSWLVITLTFDSSPIKGEGILSVVWSCSPSAHSVRHWDSFDPLPSRGEGVLCRLVIWVCFGCAMFLGF